MSVYSTISCQGQGWLLKMLLAYWHKGGGSLTDVYPSAWTMLIKLYKQLSVCITISQRTKIKAKLFRNSTQRDVSTEMTQLFFGYLNWVDTDHVKMPWVWGTSLNDISIVHKELCHGRKAEFHIARHNTLGWCSHRENEASRCPHTRSRLQNWNSFMHIIYCISC